MASGQRVVAGRYRLLAPLGSGGMGTVWRARDEVLGREVAVKEIAFPPGVSAGEREVLQERTRREARAAARLDHPSAVTVYDVVQDGDAPYLVMELVEARTLADVVREDGALAPERTAEIGLALLGALEAAHLQGIVHRDVKPSNVLVRDDGRVVLTDFGIATSTGESSITHTGLLLGSPAYIPPERARGEAPAPAADLWSLGATLFTAVEGRPPYDGGEPMLTVTAVVTGDHAPYVAAGPLQEVLDGLLEKDPSQRLDAAGARSLLQRVVDGAPRTRRLTAAAPVPAAGAAAGVGADRTAALHLGDVGHEVEDAQPLEARVAPPAAAPVAAPTRRQRAWAAPAVGALALLGLAGGALALADREGEPRASAPAPSPAASAPAPAEPSPSPEPSPEPTEARPSPTAAAPEPAVDEAVAGVPAGWSTDTGRAGWTVALPPGYAQTRSGEYRQASTGRTLRVDTGPGQPDAVADRERQAEDFARRHPSYEQIRIEPVDYRGYEAADWEFTYKGLHVVNRVFVVDGIGHSLFFQTRAGDFAQAREDFAGIAAAFQPAGA